MTKPCLYITVETVPGTMLDKAIEEMVRLADKTGISVVAMLNSVRTVVHPGDYPEAVYAAWVRAIQRKPKLGALKIVDGDVQAAITTVAEAGK